MFKRLLFGVGLVALLLTNACSGSSTDPSANTNLSGNWSGTISSSATGTGSLNMTLAQSGSAITGTSQAIYPTGTLSGSLSGTLTGLSLTATTAPSNPNLCPSNVTAIVNNAGTQISGTTATFNCTAAVSGTFNVTKQ